MLLKIFISWSGPTSKRVALALREWLPNVVQFLDPWMSSEDIDKGARWNSDVATQLEQSSIGIICLSPDNLDSPWVLFEAGALSKTLDNTFVCPYLFCLDATALRGPLLQFQATVANKDDTYKLVCTICKSLEGFYLPETRLRTAFEQWWPSLESELKKIDCPEPNERPGPLVPSERELLEELLELVRNKLDTRQSAGAPLVLASAGVLPRTLSRHREVTRGLINPALFGFLGKKMRIAFLSVDNLSGVDSRLQNEDFESLVTVGPQNLIVTHLSETRYDMVYDLSVALGPRHVSPGTPFASEVLEEINSFPCFVVDDYFKLRGAEIKRQDLSVFSSPDSLLPTLEEITRIVRLATDWNDDSISKDERRKFLNRKWILSVIDSRPQHTSHIVTVFLDHAGPELDVCQAAFEERIVAELIREPIVTLFCKGQPEALHMHYLIRLSTDNDSAYSMVKHLTALATTARLIIKTELYLVVRKESRLAFEKALLVPSLPTDEANYRNSHIVPRLSATDRTRLIYMPQQVQREFISQYRLIQEATGRLAQLTWFEERRSDFERNVAKGLLTADLALLKEAHDILLYRVETVLKHFIEEEVPMEQFESWRETLQIPRKNMKQLTFIERTKLAISFLQSDSAHPELLESVKALLDANAVRNALAHGEIDRVSTALLVDAMLAYSNFLVRWDQFN